jgi:hypothetical protein
LVLINEVVGAVALHLAALETALAFGAHFALRATSAVLSASSCSPPGPTSAGQAPFARTSCRYPLLSMRTSACGPCLHFPPNSSPRPHARVTKSALWTASALCWRSNASVRPRYQGSRNV